MYGLSDPPHASHEPRQNVWQDSQVACREPGGSNIPQFLDLHSSCIHDQVWTCLVDFIQGLKHRVLRYCNYLAAFASLKWECSNVSALKQVCFDLQGSSFQLNTSICVWDRAEQVMVKLIVYLAPAGQP